MIRRMEERDLAAVAELEKLCFSEHWSYHILESGIHSPYDVYYVFEQEGKILGYCNLRVLAGEGEVQRIAVHPDSRRQRRSLLWRWRSRGRCHSRAPFQSWSRPAFAGWQGVHPHSSRSRNTAYRYS